MYHVFENINAKGIKPTKKEQNNHASMLRVKTSNIAKPQHLALSVHPLSLTLAASTSVAPSKADVDAQACGATYLPPSAACRAPPIGLNAKVSLNPPNMHRNTTTPTYGPVNAANEIVANAIPSLVPTIFRLGVKLATAVGIRHWNAPLMIP